MKGFSVIALLTVLSFSAFAQGEQAFWRIGNSDIHYNTGQVCYSVEVKMENADRQLSYATLRFVYDNNLLGSLGEASIANPQNNYIVEFIGDKTIKAGSQFGFTGDEVTLSRISVAPNPVELLEIGEGKYTKVFDLCFDVVPAQIPAPFSASIVFDINHTTLTQGAAADKGYFTADAGVATQYYVNGVQELLAADDEVEEYYCWKGAEEFDGLLNQLDDVVGTSVQHSVTGIDDIDWSALDFNVFPNPAIEELHIDLTDFRNAEVLIQVSDEAGKLVQSRVVKNVDKDNITLNIERLSTGNYFVRLSSQEKEIGTKPFTKVGK